MLPSHSRAALVTTLALAAACASTSTSDSVHDMPDNVLLAPWSGPYGGVPPFDRMELDDLEPALDAGMAKNLAEIDVIAGNPAPPTFENTIVALEDAGRDLGRVFNFFGIWSANLSSPEFREVQGRVVPKLSDFNSKITQNAALFARIRAVYEGEELATLRPDQQRLTRLVYDGFARNGATLEGEAKRSVRTDPDQRLAELHTKFRQQRAGGRGEGMCST